MLKGEVLIFEFVSVDGFSTSAVMVGEITSLTHEVGDDTVECGGFESIALLAGAQSAEVLASLGNDVGTKLKRECDISFIEDNFLR